MIYFIIYIIITACIIIYGRAEHHYDTLRYEHENPGRKYSETIDGRDDLNAIFALGLFWLPGLIFAGIYFTLVGIGNLFKRIFRFVPSPSKYIGDKMFEKYKTEETIKDIIE